MSTKIKDIECKHCQEKSACKDSFPAIYSILGTLLAGLLTPLGRRKNNVAFCLPDSHSGGYGQSDQVVFAQHLSI